MSILDNLQSTYTQLPPHVTLVAVSKTKPISSIMALYNAGHRIFGENKIQELVGKYNQMPKDIKWHMIGHLQRNKVKYIASFIDLIHSVDQFRLLQEINRQAEKHQRVIPCLLQIKIASEESKFGMSYEDVFHMVTSHNFNKLQHIKVIGLMGMATYTEDRGQIKKEFDYLKAVYDDLKAIQKDNFYLEILSMGMSSDYNIAIDSGSNMVRIGSHIFGSRN